MSKPKPPYFYKTDANTYHWELKCSANHYKFSNQNWHLLHSPPQNSAPCQQCLDKTHKTQQFWDRQK